MNYRMLSFIAIVLAFSLNSVSAADQPKSASNYKTGQQKGNYLLDYSIPEAFYNYFDFKFNATNGANYNRYQGHSSQYGLGSNVVSFPMNMLMGLYLYHVDTSLNSQFFVSPGLPMEQQQSIKNDTLLLHILKPVGILVFDVAGAYGRTTTHNQLVTLPNAPGQLTGYGRGSNNNWYLSAASLFAYNWSQLMLRGDIRLLYSEAQSGNYPVYFTSNVAPLQIGGVTTKATWVMENAELGYKLNENLTPFISGGLVQVPHYRSSRPLIANPIIGGLPQLNLNKSGYKIGGGLALRYKQLSLRLEQKYYKTGTTYSSNQTFVKLVYQTT